MVKKVRFLPFETGRNLSWEERRILEDARAILEDGFYYSYGYDVTCSRQRRQKWINTQSTSLERMDSLALMAADPDYFWNLNLYKEFIAQKVDSHWFCPLT